MGRRPTVETDTLIALAKQGKTAEEIGAKVSLTAAAVHARLGRLGGIKKFKPKAELPISDDALKERIAAGATYNDLAEETGVENGALHKHIVRLGGVRFIRRQAAQSDAIDALGDSGKCAKRMKPTDENIRKMALAGRSDDEIAQLTGISPIKACAIVGRMGMLAQRATIRIEAFQRSQAVDA